jgi:hypothetical protein
MHVSTLAGRAYRVMALAGRMEVGDMAEPRYTAGEKARMTALVARGAVRIGRGKGTAPVDRALDRIEREAIERTEAEERAKENKRQADIKAKAEKRAARTFW